MRAVVAATLLTGCFYIDPIVAPPTVRICIEQSDLIARDSSVTLHAQIGGTCGAADSAGTYDWKVTGCKSFNPGTGATDCDSEPFFPPPGSPQLATPSTVAFQVPVYTADHTLTQGIQVQLQARNDRGAVAERNGPADFAVADGPPTLEVAMSARSYVVGAPIDLFATYRDPEDPLGSVAADRAVTFTPVPPHSSSGFSLLPLTVPADPTHFTVGKRLIAGEAGDWSVTVTAHDLAHNTVERSLAFRVDPDQPPCLAQWQPIVPPSGATLPITEPTVFQVPLVDDDLDAYPPILDAPQYGTTTFAWSILPPRAAQRQVLAGATGNRVELDPAAFTPGDLVELRVEIADRAHTAALPCDDSAASCSITGATSCLQRLTWRVEAR